MEYQNDKPSAFEEAIKLVQKSRATLITRGEPLNIRNQVIDELDHAIEHLQALKTKYERIQSAESRLESIERNMASIKSIIDKSKSRAQVTKASAISAPNKREEKGEQQRNTRQKVRQERARYEVCGVAGNTMVKGKAIDYWLRQWPRPR